MSEINNLSVVMWATDGTHVERAVTGAAAIAARYSTNYEIIIAAGPAATDAAARAANRPFVYATYHRQPRRPAYLLRDACTLIGGELVLAFDAATPPSASALERLLTAYDGQDIITGMRTPAPANLLHRTHTALLKQILVSDQADPLLPLALFRAELIDLLPGDGELAPPLAHVYAVARRRNYTTAQIALPAHSAPTRPSTIGDVASLAAQGPARSTRPALGTLIVVASLWLLLRRRR
ncbi:hypothetical protein [Chloroflexus aggregans]|uniref:Glycosyl transferase family 2 n=1 Tax=Chloroflexus aggregans (strain MD-66 / DSM 9485) TaxID=326427 RepID=B8G428_CHLAD|nr:hypothetical protein [Chloroflexus aggregans]ACL25430.1 conserved hypothetical protein [Chloroflexus aggregans DSM 9485]